MMSRQTEEGDGGDESSSRDQAERTRFETTGGGNEMRWAYPSHLPVRINSDEDLGAIDRLPDDVTNRSGAMKRGVWL